MSSGGLQPRFLKVSWIRVSGRPDRRFSALPSGRRLNHLPAMQKATPLILVLFLAVTATILSVRSHKVPVTRSPAEVEKAPAPEAKSAGIPIPPPAADIPTVKATPKAWPQAGSDIAPDKAATFGTLENGLRYIIYPNSEPPKRVSLRLHISAGSLMEADDQRGIAHFLEHMVFNGSKTYSAGRVDSENAAPRDFLRCPRRTPTPPSTRRFTCSICRTSPRTPSSLASPSCETSVMAHSSPPRKSTKSVVLFYRKRSAAIPSAPASWSSSSRKSCQTRW